MSIKRGCGTRVAGGIYMASMTSPFGHPIEEFIVDPPAIIDPEKVGISAVGVTHFPERNWIVDWVGANYYPNVADFIEEARLIDPRSGTLAGVSRRLPRTFDFSKINSSTLLVLVHPKAGINRAAAYAAAEANIQQRALHDCPQVIGFEHCARPIREQHPGQPVACARFWWQDLVGGVETMLSYRHVKRIIPSGAYTGWSPAWGQPPDHSPAVFMRLPFKLEVIRDPNGEHRQALERANLATVPVELCDA